MHCSQPLFWRDSILVTGLFAGIGGFELAFQEAGFATKLLVEIDTNARAVLAIRFPNAQLSDDVTLIESLPEETSIVTAGFPCQNLSMAGDKSGISGDKSGIVKKLFDLVERRDVPTVVIENVYFMLQLDKGQGMRWLVSQFEALGYQWAYRVLDSFGFGLPQRRRRVYLIASKTVDPRRILFADIQDKPTKELPRRDKPLGFYWTEGKSGVGFTVDGIPPLKVGSSLGIPSAPAVFFPDGEVLTPSLEACERIQGFPTGWTDIPEEGVTHARRRWRLLGNAVSVPVAHWVAQRLQSPGVLQAFETAPFDHVDSARWPDAAWNVGEGIVSVAANDQPLRCDRPSIESYRDEGWRRLSDRALDGFLSRATSGGLRMPSWFLDGLRSAKRATKATPLHASTSTEASRSR